VFTRAAQVPVPAGSLRRVKERLDVVLVERGLAGSRSQAQALIMAGRAMVDGVVVDKAGAPVGEGADVSLTQPPRYVSRGGEKLETALRELAIDVTGERCLDVGASTGGFTDCLLQHGAESVVALDVGRGQLHERLRSDPRVVVMERQNVRSLTADMLPFRPSFVTADVSFISLRTALPAALAAAQEPWRAVVLVKPQFEAGREHVRKGVVRDPEVRRAALQGVADFATSQGLVVLGVCDSSLPGPAGNREYLMALASGEHLSTGKRVIDVAEAIRDAVGDA
jgi:23S rRNA (cytidine1920-2'-O)/16S rRNA (cytidine1409-2'-O)-methyltransferase